MDLSRRTDAVLAWQPGMGGQHSYVVQTISGGEVRGAICLGIPAYPVVAIRMDPSHVHPATCSLELRGPRRHDHPQPAGKEEPAYVRVLRRVTRPLPRPRLRRRREGRRAHRRGRRLLVRRRRARDHRAADEDGHARAAPVHADDGRPRQSDPRLPAARRRGRRRDLRRRGGDHGDGLRPPRRDAGEQGGVSVHARRPRRVRHGRMRDSPPDHRAGPRRRIALHRPLDARRRGRAVGLLQPACRVRAPSSIRRTASPTTSRTARRSPTR